MIYSLTKAIQSVENQWLDELYNLSKDAFEQVKIPSHDHFHHKRVWDLSKTLLLELNKVGVIFTQDEIEQLIIAVFFHDYGMIETIDPKHGYASRMLCHKYFIKNHPNFSNNLNVILDAIEHHDDKEYKSRIYHGERHREIMSILCVCDDLDAFGAIGVFRYMEIYMLRGMKISELAPAILPNVKNRFNNLLKLYGHLSTFMANQSARYKYISQFYEQLQSGENSESFHAILSIFEDGILNGKETIYSICAFAKSRSDNEIVRQYFQEFGGELSIQPKCIN